MRRIKHGCFSWTHSLIKGTKALRGRHIRPRLTLLPFAVLPITTEAQVLLPLQSMTRAFTCYSALPSSVLKPVPPPRHSEFLFFPHHQPTVFSHSHLHHRLHQASSFSLITSFRFIASCVFTRFPSILVYLTVFPNLFHHS